MVFAHVMGQLAFKVHIEDLAASLEAAGRDANQDQGSVRLLNYAAHGPMPYAELQLRVEGHPARVRIEQSGQLKSHSFRNAQEAVIGIRSLVSTVSKFHSWW